MYDVVVAGARCAGSPLSMLLARKGYRVLALDKSRFPSDTVSTHVIWHAGLARARNWGLLDRITVLGAPPIRACSFDIGDIGFRGAPPPLDGLDFATAPRRMLLDKVLVDAAREAGAEVREGFYVSNVILEDGRVTGIEGRIAGGGTVVERARIVVGADGVHSLIARSVRAQKYDERPPLIPDGYYAYWLGGPPVTDFEIHVRPGVACGMFPTNDGKACIVAGWSSALAAPEVRPAEAYPRALAAIPRAAEFLKSAQQAEPLMGMGPIPGFFRQSHGPGWALAGDAGYHKHPLSAQGITDAFRDADLLAEAIDAGLSGRRDLDEALADYQRRRDEAVLPMYESTCQRARLAPFPPHAVALFRALRVNQHEADRFFGTDAGTVPMTDFFAPENLERIVRSASSAAGSAS